MELQPETNALAFIVKAKQSIKNTNIKNDWDIAGQLYKLFSAEIKQNPSDYTSFIQHEPIERLLSFIQKQCTELAVNQYEIEQSANLLQGPII